jgi:phosphoglycolate phosphatase
LFADQGGHFGAETAFERQDPQFVKRHRAPSFESPCPEQDTASAMLPARAAVLKSILADLVLFDIDGTLVRRAGPHHRQALVDAVREVTGRETTTEGIPVHGMLDPDILSKMMLAGGMDASEIRAAMPEVIERAQQLYQASVPDLRDKTCPGVVPLLEHLLGRGITLALVTGNLTRIGWKKLERAGLDRYFRFGAFGEMAPTRGGLARLAIEQAQREGFVDGRISLVGDAVQDVIAAKENGIRSIAVRTGITPPDELEASSPDLLVTDLDALDRIIFD